MDIFWTRIARREVIAACDYIAKRNPRAAEMVEEHILEAVARLADFPNMGRIGRVAGTRELVITRLPYIVIYSVGTRRITILHILHTAQAWPPPTDGDENE